MTDTLEFIYSDQTKGLVSVFSSRTDEETKDIFLLLPAMGIRASYYREFARELSLRGRMVCTVDWRGHGYSSVRPSHKVNFGYSRLIEDAHELILYLKNKFKFHDISIIGHSLGGQIATLLLAKYPDAIKSMITVASSSVYHKEYEGYGAWRIKLATRLFPIVYSIVGYHPGALFRFGGNEAKDVMKDWSHNGRYGSYVLINDSFDYEKALVNVKKNILAIMIENDPFASENGIRHLHAKLAASNTSYIMVTAEKSSIDKLGHFNWAKKPVYFADIIESWFSKSG